MELRASMLLLGVAFTMNTGTASAEVTLTVGPSASYQKISAAVAAANADEDLSNYYVINVEPGTYTNDFPEVYRPMTIQANPLKAGQQVLLQATVPLPNQKGIILTFASLRINGLTLIGANIANSLGGNGAGIRDQNTGTPATLVVENSTLSTTRKASSPATIPARPSPSTTRNSGITETRMPTIFSTLSTSTAQAA
jgi:hypothetical protein